MTETLAGSTLQGTPVVGGLAYGPAIWPGERPSHDPETLGVGTEVAEADRESEIGRFTDAAGVVAGRLRDRASHSSGAAAEVLAATAGLAEDRGWIGAASGLIRKGATAPLSLIHI